MTAAITDISYRRGKVVVIGDDQPLRELAALHLRANGYEVATAPDAVEGLQTIVLNMPDIVVCDVDMAYLDGYQFVGALKAHPTTKHIRIVLLTVRNDADAKAAEFGVAGCLQKPVAADRLVEAVGRLVE